MEKVVYLIPHAGLGDIITMIGAVKILVTLYDKVYMFCKEKYLNNVKLLFKNLTNLYFITAETDHKFYILFSTLNTQNSDILPCLLHKLTIKTRITNPKLLSYIPNNKDYTVPWNHIKIFYTDVHLDLTTYYEEFDIPSSPESQKYYDIIKNYKILFAHTQASNEQINLDQLFNEYVSKDDFIIICADKNVYPKNHIKYNIASEYVNIYVAYYIDIIKAAEEIHVIDSCFTCIVHPLHILNKLNCKQPKIYTR